jgi:prepilin-type N-terminal cleavage/methylation domain-containing protein
MKTSTTKTSGFTITEMVIVIVLTAILATAILVRWSYFSTSLDTQTALLINNIRYTQNLSMSKNERYRLVIDTVNNSYSIKNNVGTTVELPNGSYITSFPYGISFGSLTNITNNTIIFDAKGVPYTGSGAGTIIAATATIVLQNNSGDTRTIQISPATGKVTP